LLDDLASQYRRRGTDLSTQIASHCSLPIRTQAVRRAVANLIDNALRYAGSDKPLELALAIHDRNAVIEVRDRGPGIPPEHAERLKLPFTRLEAARTNAMGAGLGLAIVDRIARSHGGTFDLLARPGGGLIARIALPMGR
jgi:two-component system osmolarity sensor histidine kinase EnvZ